MGARQVGNLTVRAKLNEQSQYDIIGINFHVPSSGATSSIKLPDSPPAVTSNNEPSGMCGDQQFSHLAALSSRSQFTQASIGRSHSQDVSVGKVRQGQIPDPENPAKMTTQGALNKRRFDRKQVPDPENPGLTITQGVLNHRKYDRQQVPDPANPGHTISKGALDKRKLVPDPINLGQMISQDARSQQKLVWDPENPELMISQSAKSQRKYLRTKNPTK